MILHRLARCGLFFLALLALPLGIVSASDAVYVSPAGDDANSGSDFQHALCSIEQAVITARQSGVTTLRLAAGTYTLPANFPVDSDWTLCGGYAGTELSPDARRVPDNDRPWQWPHTTILQPAAPLTLNHALVLDGITLQNGTQPFALISGEGALTLSRCTVAGAAATSFITLAEGNLAIKGSLFSSCTGTLLSINGGSANIEETCFYNNAVPLACVGGESTVARCRFFNNSGSVTASGTLTCENTLFAHNGSAHNPALDGRGARAVNCIFYCNASASASQVRDAYSLNTLFYGHAAALPSTQTSRHAYACANNTLSDGANNNMLITDNSLTAPSAETNGPLSGRALDDFLRDNYAPAKAYVSTLLFGTIEDHTSTGVRMVPPEDDITGAQRKQNFVTIGAYEIVVAPEMSISPAALLFANTDSETTVTVSNFGTAQLAYRIAVGEGADFLSIEAPAQTLYLNEGGSYDVKVRCTANTSDSARSGAIVFTAVNAALTTRLNVTQYGTIPPTPPVPPTPVYYTLTLIDACAPDTQLRAGDTTLVTANAAPDSMVFAYFVQDSVIVSDTTPFYLTMPDTDVTLTAHFEPITPPTPPEPPVPPTPVYYTLTLIDAFAPDTQLRAGDTTLVTANAAPDSMVFAYFVQDSVIVSDTTPFYLTMPDTDVTLTAHFEPVTPPTPPEPPVPPTPVVVRSLLTVRDNGQVWCYTLDSGVPFDLRAAGTESFTFAAWEMVDGAGTLGSETSAETTFVARGEDCVVCARYIPSQTPKQFGFTHAEIAALHGVENSVGFCGTPGATLEFKVKSDPLFDVILYVDGTAQHLTQNAFSHVCKSERTMQISVLVLPKCTYNGTKKIELSLRKSTPSMKPVGHKKVTFRYENADGAALPYQIAAVQSVHVLPDSAVLDTVLVTRETLQRSFASLNGWKLVRVGLDDDTVGVSENAQDWLFDFGGRALPYGQVYGLRAVFEKEPPNVADTRVHALTHTVAGILYCGKKLCIGHTIDLPDTAQSLAGYYTKPFGKDWALGRVGKESKFACRYDKKSGQWVMHTALRIVDKKSLNTAVKTAFYADVLSDKYQTPVGVAFRDKAGTEYGCAVIVPPECTEFVQSDTAPTVYGRYFGSKATVFARYSENGKMKKIALKVDKNAASDSVLVIKANSRLSALTGVYEIVVDNRSGYAARRVNK